MYSFSSNNAPSSTELTEARLEIEDKARQQKKKEREEGAGAWSLGRVEEFYRESCGLRDEVPLGGVIGALRVSVNHWLIVIGLNGKSFPLLASQFNSTTDARFDLCETNL